MPNILRVVAAALLLTATSAHTQGRVYVPKAVEVAGMAEKEAAAATIWNLRAALNVAALQCQFSPYLRTVAIYNAAIRQHSRELERVRATLAAFFGKRDAKGPARGFDQFTTRTYQSYSTLDAQRPFCDAAATAGNAVLAQPVGTLGEIAPPTVASVRASLTPAGDPLATLTSLTPLTSDVAMAACADRDRRRGRC